MSELARMRFQSATKPAEEGVIILTADGALHIEPSPAMIETIAELEQQAVEKSARVSKTITALLIGAGMIVAAVGWCAGRIGGRLRDLFIEPRSLNMIDAQYDSAIGFRLRLRENALQSTTLTWQPGEYNSDEVEHFMDLYHKLREAPNSLG